MAESSEIQRCGPPAIQDIAVAVVAQDDGFVVGVRPQDVTLGGLSEFPGGKIEHGETAEQAAVRECHEEVGMDVAAIGHYGEVLHEYSGEQSGRGQAFTVRIHFIACRPVDERQPLRSPFRWVTAAELTLLEFPAANADLIRQLSTGIPPCTADCLVRGRSKTTFSFNP